MALVTLDLFPEVGQSKTRHLLQTMAAGLSSTTVWHKSLRNITVISGENLDKFVNKQGVGKQTSVRGYKFFLEGYIHNVEGLYTTVLGSYMLSSLLKLQLINQSLC